MNNYYNDGNRTSRLIIVIVSIVLIIGLTLFALFIALGNGTGEMQSKEDILASIEAIGDEDRGHGYVASYLTDYGIGSFKADRFRSVELYFQSFYVGELPKMNEHAVATAELFLSTFYDSIDLEDTNAVTDALLKCYVHASGDPYAYYRTADEFGAYDDEMSGEFVGIGVSVQQEFVEGTYNIKSVYILDVLEGSGAEAAGIKSGDYITAVDGVPVTDFDGDSIVYAIRGETGSKVDITVSRDGKELIFSCIRSYVEEISASASIEGGIGYITITSFKENTAEQFHAAFNEAITAQVRGIVFDLRNNPGGYLDSVIEVISALVPEGTRVVSYTDRISGETVYTSEGGTALKIPIVVLCNENTASAGELFTAAMRDYNDMGILNATIVGSTTYGKGIMQSSYPLVDGSYLTMTMAYYNPPSDVNYHGEGITPDYEVPMGDDGDTQMTFATELIKKIIADLGKLAA